MLHAHTSNQTAPQQHPRDWAKATDKELIAHVLERYHVRHREQLPELIGLAEKVERVHADHPDVPAGLAAHLVDMLQELESHMQKEEHILFPMILRGQKNMAVGPISVMESEHVQHMEALQKMLMLAVAVGFVLLAPLVAMQFTDEVVWTSTDFVTAVALLFAAEIGRAHV